MTQPVAHIALPPPISVNNLYANVKGRGRIKSGRYNTWCRHAAALIGDQKPLPQFFGPVSISLHVGQSGVGNMDADNTAKAYIDALVTAHIIQKDSKGTVRSVHIEWVPDMVGCVASISPAKERPSAGAIAALVDTPDVLEVRGAIT